MNETKKPNGGIDIDIDAKTALGQYANLAIISHSKNEFIVDFAAMLPGMPKPAVCSRILLTPEHAKRLMLSLQENVSRYENNFGKIELSQHAPFKVMGDA